MYIALTKLLARASVRMTALTFAYSISRLNDIDVFSLAETVLRIWPYLLVFATAGVAYDLVTRSWRKSWRFTSLKDVLVMIRSSTLMGLALLLAIFAFDRGVELPRSALLLTWLLDIGIFGALLMLRRAAHEKTLADTFAPFLNRDFGHRVPLMLMGTLEAADAFLRELSREPSPKYRPVGLIAAHARDVRHEIRGVRAIGSIEDAQRLLLNFSKLDGDRAVLFLEGAPAPADLDAELISRLRAKGVGLLRTNRVTDLDSQLGSTTLRELNFNELLTRPPVYLDRDRIRQLISGKRVLVTGAGGSIGSEICRQAAELSCAHLTMIDNSEFSLFKIDQEVADTFPTLSRSARLCDVRDGSRVHRFVTTEEPDIVFHAAALKHVPLMEAHPADSALTNIIGSANVADAAIAAGSNNFVLISTDKAVDPPNIMGATKRLAERVVFQRRHEGGPHINVVRFGNVLGSAGSVVPTFLEQIARGGPVTLTHPDIERYFMTIPEAVQLVLHATAKSAVDHVAGVLILDMGKPVKIIDLARRLIELHGKVPGADIDIRVTGLRPGEKMTESLVDITETARPCDPGMMEVVDQNANVQLSDSDMQRLEKAARAGDDDSVREIIFDCLKALRTFPDSEAR